MWSLPGKIRYILSKDCRFIGVFYSFAGLIPTRLSLYRLALAPLSIAKKHDKFGHSNERLEFLGDAVLGAIVADLLFRKYPYKSEGFLTDMRSHIVNRDSLNWLGKKVGIDSMLLCYHAHTKVSLQPRELGDALEAIVGAVYLDKGYATCKRFVIEKLVKPHYDLQLMADSIFNYKSKLIEWSRRNHKTIFFKVDKLVENAPYALFKAQVFLDNKVYGKGVGRTKKKATQEASQNTYLMLKETFPL